MSTRNIVIVVGVVAAVGAGMCRAQDMRENLGRSLFSDQKATRVGDALTILVMESSTASNDAKTSTSRESGISLSGSGKSGSSAGTSVEGNIGTGNTFKGEGETSNKGFVRTKISARVDSVLPNGNIFINGSRSITINGEEQVIKISGIVRPADIQGDNTVYSYNISDATLVVQGDGVVSRAQGPGWITKLFHWLF